MKIHKGGYLQQHVYNCKILETTQIPMTVAECLVYLQNEDVTIKE